MKKQQNNSTNAWALHVALSVALLSISAVLLASGFKPTLAASGLRAAIKPVAAGDPASGTWTATGNLTTARYGHTATLLPDGKVLVAGGADTSFNPIASAELYDPASETWSAVGSLSFARKWHTATLLPDGKVLVAGGNNGGAFLNSAELYDPASGMWTATGIL